MGYTHYFKQEKPITNEQWNKFQKDAEKILNYIQEVLNIQLTSDSEENVMINTEWVNINGVDDDSHETFYLTKDYKEFNFCKTAGKPYDLAVCALLLLAYKYFPKHHDISSDGEFEDWKNAMELNAKVLYKGYKLPPAIDSSSEVKNFEKELSDMIKKIKLNNKLDKNLSINKEQIKFKL